MSNTSLPPLPPDLPRFKVLGFVKKAYNGGRVVAYAKVRVGDLWLGNVPLILCADSLSETPAYRGWGNYGLMVDAPSKDVWFNEETRKRLEAYIVCHYLAWLAVHHPRELAIYGLGDDSQGQETPETDPQPQDEREAVAA